MTYECNCTNISADKWELLMKGNRKASKVKVIKAAIEAGVISKEQGQTEIKKPYYNPYQQLQTKTHYIYVNSCIEHFITKN